MPGYIRRVAIVALTFLFLHFSISIFIPSPIASEYWVRELIIIKNALADSVSSPRIIFLGGSSTLFGVDAKQVESELGIPAMNMGLHAAMQLERVLSIGEMISHAHDIVVLPLEAHFYSCDADTWDNWRATSALTWDRPYFDNLPLAARIEAVYSTNDPALMFEVLADKIGAAVVPGHYVQRTSALAPANIIWERYQSGRYRSDGFAYSAYNIDDRGDMLGNNESGYSGPGVSASDPEGICPAAYGMLKSFIARMNSRGVRVIIAHAPYLIDTVPTPGWQAAEARFSKDVASLGPTLLDRREELFFPRGYFFNTDLHLNSAGRRARTVLLVRDLKRLGIGAHQPDADRRSISR